MHFAYTTILNAPRFGWQPAPPKRERLALYKRVMEIGFTGLEWSPRWCDIHKLPNGEVALLSEEVHSSGLRVSAINLNRFILSRCDEAAEHRDRLLDATRAASLLGAGSVIISLSLPQPPTDGRPVLVGHTIPEKEFSETALFLKRAAHKAKELGVKLVLELHDDGLLDSADRCLRMLELVDESNVSLNPDLGNLIRQHQRPETWRAALAKLAPHTGYWHIKNYRGGNATPIWEGEIDYVEAISSMRRAGYAGWMSIESYFGDHVMELQQESVNWLRQVTSRGTA